MEKLLRYKMILFGMANVGKTALVDRYINNKFERDYIATLGYNVFEKKIPYEDVNISLLIYDIGGQEQFRELRKKYAKGANTALLIYDITSRESFNTLSSWRQDLQLFVGEIPFIIIGNKLDLEANRQVSNEEAMQLSYQLGASDFFETSALTGEKVEEAFSQLAIQTYKAYYG